MDSDCKPAIEGAEGSGHWRLFLLPGFILLLAGVMLVVWREHVLRYGVFRSSPATVALALTVGADPNRIGADGSRPLEAALMLATGASEILGVLMKGGANPNLPNAQGWLPLQTALEYCPAPLIKQLVDGGLDIHQKDQQGYDALLLAILQARPDAALLFLEKGADPDVEAKTGVTPLFLALDRKDSGMVKYLLERGARNLGRNQAGKTGLDLARAAEDPELLRLVATIARELDGKSDSAPGR